MQQLHLKLEYIFTKEIGISNHRRNKSMPGIALTASPEAPLLQQQSIKLRVYFLNQTWAVTGQNQG
jgi:hypothetical protein